jgi:prephenate dehydrogenase
MAAMECRWPKITLVGVGLLGGSLGMAIRQRGIAARVAGYVRRAAAIEECLRLGAVDEAGVDLTEAVKGAGLVVLCTPIAQMRPLTEQMLPGLSPGTLVTDVGSVKECVLEELEPLLDRVSAWFIGSHPMAGAEKVGVRSAVPDLFEGATCVVTPTPRCPPDLVEKVKDFWAAVGGKPLVLTAQVHDELVSRSSHLPHVVAAELAHSVLDPVWPKEQALLCATGFRDTTRIASGSPEMWRDIVLANRQNLAQALRLFTDDLRALQRALEEPDIPAITGFLERAKQRRDAWSGQGRSPE